MQTNLYSIRDLKLDTYDLPWAQQNDEAAKRLFKRMLENIPLMKDNPQDFDLHLIGHYDDTSALVKSTAVQFIVSGLSLVLTPSRDDSNANLQKTKVSNDASIQPSS